MRDYGTQTMGTRRYHVDPWDERRFEPWEDPRPPIQATVTVERANDGLSRIERIQLRQQALTMALEYCRGLPAMPQPAEVTAIADGFYLYLVDEAPVVPRPVQLPPSPQQVQAAPVSPALVSLAQRVDRHVSYWRKTRTNTHLVDQLGPLLDESRSTWEEADSARA